MIQIEDASDERLAINDFSSSSGKIIRWKIKFNMAMMLGGSDDQILHIMLHELGHTLGLDDIKDIAKANTSVMYFNVGDMTKIFTDYPAFDKDNILWKYSKQ